MEDDSDRILPIRSHETVSFCAVTVELNQPRLHLKVDSKILVSPGVSKEASEMFEMQERQLFSFIGVECHCT